MIKILSLPLLSCCLSFSLVLPVLLFFVHLLHCLFVVFVFPVGCSADRCIAIDCEFVGVGPNGSTSVLARCSIVNHHGHVLYDSYVKPKEPVTDYRTWVSGVKPKHLKDGESGSGWGRGLLGMYHGKSLQVVDLWPKFQQKVCWVIAFTGTLYCTDEDQ